MLERRMTRHGSLALAEANEVPVAKADETSQQRKRQQTYRPYSWPLPELWLQTFSSLLPLHLSCYKVHFYMKIYTQYGSQHCKQ